MKKHLSLLTILLIAFNIHGQNIPNGDFENWSNGNPVNWSTYNELAALLGISPAPVTQESPAPSGNSYLKATAKFSFLAGETIPGVALLGNADLVNETGSIGIPFTQTPAYFTGVFKHEMVSANDSMLIVCQLTKWDAINNAQIFIGGVVGYNFENSVTDWTNFSYPIQYESSEIPDSLFIGIVSIGEDGAAVSIDNLGFSSNGVSVSEQNELENSVVLFPNPTKNQVFVDLSGMLANSEESLKIEVYDVNGNLVTSFMGIRSPLFTINASELATGKYLVRISNSQFSTTKTLIRQ
jgi:hypothetical protein